jgi:hypothetical protein
VNVIYIEFTVSLGQDETQGDIAEDQASSTALENG